MALIDIRTDLFIATPKCCRSVVCRKRCDCCAPGPATQHAYSHLHSAHSMRQRCQPYAARVTGAIRAVDQTAVLVPVKAFGQAKVRLSSALSSTQRATLARRMASRVVRAQSPGQVWVCCDDDDVAQWAHSAGAQVIWCPGTGLNEAVAAGFAHLRDCGFTDVAIAHSDLPLATPFTPFGGWPGVTIVPDRHRTGTNVMIVPTSLRFEFAYGSGSFARHVAEAVRHRHGLRVIHDAALGWDVDHPEDLALPDGSTLAT